ncbi:MAG TPA: alpha/beta hydrolase, partial [Candidatus Hydrogenedentes bacterium]|nr:alpha/beta hydrolase [Candidatus Hydrogenedentota bacterium]
ALVVQASDDPTVRPDSAPALFAGLGSAEKELTVFQRARHGIVNGDGSAAVHDRVAAFLRQTLVQRPSPGAVLMEKAFPKPESTVDAASLTIEADSGPEDESAEEDEALHTLPSG